jgi:hypothetical protein
MKKKTLAEEFKDFLKGVDDERITRYYPERPNILVTDWEGISNDFDTDDFITGVRDEYLPLDNGWEILSSVSFLMKDGSRLKLEYFNPANPDTGNRKRFYKVITAGAYLYGYTLEDF